MVRFAVLLGLCACGFDGGVRLDDGAGGADGSAPECNDWSAPLFLDPCGLEDPGATGLSLTTGGRYLYNTDELRLEDPGGTPVDHQAVVQTGVVDYVVVNTGSFVLGSETTLRLVGSRPWALAAWSTIEINGFLEANSSVEGAGAGANTGMCNAATEGASDEEGGGGGGGGGLGGVGAGGGTAVSETVAGGMAGGIVDVQGLRGGCAGLLGGHNPIDFAGDGGAGGGGILLASRTSISVSGRIRAGGMGGGGGGGDDGGGGGGSGGVIALSSPTLVFTVEARVLANGGGGGQGGGNQGTGRRGSSARSDGTVAPGGAGGTGGRGGNGANLSAEATPGDNADSRGGGGGGGGVGYIFTRASAVQDAGALIAPAATAR